MRTDARGDAYAGLDQRFLGLILRGQRVLWVWAASFWLATLATLVLGLRGTIPEAVSVIGNNVGYAASSALMLLGIARHVRFRLSWWPPALFIGAFLAVQLWFEFVHPDLIVRMGVFNVQGIVWDAWTLRALVGRGARDIRRSAGFAGVVFAADAAYNGLRLVMLRGVLGAPDIMHTGAVMPASYVVGILLSLAQSLALILMVTERLVRDLRRLARTDELTGLLNRRAVIEAGSQALAVCRRNGLPCSLLLFDLDRFKQVNDSHGHRAGDLVLRNFADLVRRADTRSSHVLGRYGGEEFLLVMPGDGLASALRLAEALRRRVAASAVEVDGVRVGVTTSIGVAASRADSLFEQVVLEVDGALYEAKAQGRDRVVARPAVAASLEPQSAGG